MSCSLQLPPELLALIIGQLLPELQDDAETRKACKNDLHACTLVSHLWHALATPWLFYDLSYTTEIERRFRDSVSDPIYTDLQRFHVSSQSLPHLFCYLRCLRVGDASVSWPQLLLTSSFVDVMHLLPRIDTLFLHNIIMHGPASPEGEAKAPLALPRLTITSGRGKWTHTWMCLVLRAIPLFTTIRELRLSTPLEEMVPAPFKIHPAVLDPRRTSVESLVVVGAREDWHFSYRDLSQMLGDVILLSDVRSLTIVNVIDDGVLGLVQDGLECLRWQVIPKDPTSDALSTFPITIRKLCVHY